MDWDYAWRCAVLVVVIIGLVGWVFTINGVE